MGMKPSLPHGKHTGRDFLWKWLEDLRIYMAKMGGGSLGRGWCGEEDSDAQSGGRLAAKQICE